MRTSILSPSQQVWLPSAGSWFKGDYMNCLSSSNLWAMSGSAVSCCIACCFVGRTSVSMKHTAKICMWAVIPIELFCFFGILRPLHCCSDFLPVHGKLLFSWDLLVHQMRFCRWAEFDIYSPCRQHVLAACADPGGGGIKIQIALVEWFLKGFLSWKYVVLWFEE